MTETELRQACPAQRHPAGDASRTTVERLAGGAGNRVYWRISWPHLNATVRAIEDGFSDEGSDDRRAPSSVVVMELPPDPGKSEEASNEAAPVELPFLNVRRYLEQIGVRVPRIFLDEHKSGLVVLEDLTDRTLEQALLSGGDKRAIYRAAVEQLAHLRAKAEQHPDPHCLAWSRAFDFDLYQWEFEHFIEYEGCCSPRAEAEPTVTELLELRAAIYRGEAASSRRRRARSPTATTRAATSWCSTRASRWSSISRTRCKGRGSTIWSRCFATIGYVETGAAADRRNALYVPREICRARRGAQLVRDRLQCLLRSAHRAAQAEGRGPLRLHRSGEEEPVVPEAHPFEPGLREGGARPRSAARLRRRRSWRGMCRSCGTEPERRPPAVRGFALGAGAEVQLEDETIPTSMPKRSRATRRLKRTKHPNRKRRLMKTRRSMRTLRPKRTRRWRMKLAASKDRPAKRKARSRPAPILEAFEDFEDSEGLEQFEASRRVLKVRRAGGRTASAEDEAEAPVEHAHAGESEGAGATGGADRAREEQAPSSADCRGRRSRGRGRFWTTRGLARTRVSR